MREVSSGSSEKHSKPRPLRGVRIMFTVGPSSTSTPLARASRPSSEAIRWTRSEERRVGKECGGWELSSRVKKELRRGHLLRTCDRPTGGVSGGETERVGRGDE